MRADQNGIEFIRTMEGCVLTTYRDSGGQLTIGVGHLLTKAERTSGKLLIDARWVDYRDGLTQAQADHLFAQDLGTVERSVTMLCEQQLTQSQFNALVSFTFNVGIGAFMRSTLLKELNAGHYDAVPAQLQRWIYDAGVVLQVLVKRRQAEVTLWLSAT